MTDETQTSEADKSTVDDAASVHVEATIDSLFDDLPTGEEAKSEEAADTSAKGDSKEGDDGATKEAESRSEENKEAAPPAADVGLQAALVAERRGRQEAERKLEKALAEQEEAPDPVEDPEGHARYVAKQGTEGKINGSRHTMMAFKDDYSDMEKVFLGLVTDEQGNVTDSGLVAKMNAADSPAAFLYDYAQNHLEAEKLRNPETRAAMIAAEADKLVTAAVDKAVAEALKGVKPGNVDLSLKATQVPNLTDATAQGSNSLAPLKPATVDEMFSDSEL